MISANLGLPYLAAAQAQKHVTVNEALETLDTLAQLTVQDFALAAPPAAPAQGQVWAVGAAATGDWAGHEGHLALWSEGAWQFVTPRAGWRAACGSDLRVFDGSVWLAPPIAPQNIAGIGIGLSWDATNRLALASEAALFTHVGSGHQLKVNKAAAPDTASLLFQTGWSGRAELGLAGNDDLSVKVSPDGTTWHLALTADAATGAVALGQPLAIASGGTGAGTAPAARAALGLGTAATAQATTSATDGTAGRLAALRSDGIFGLGGTDAPAAPVANDPDTMLRSGLYRIDGSAKMPDPGAYVVVHLQRGGGLASQLALPVAAGAARLILRAFSGGVWGPWQQINATLGPVAQSAGVPTGAAMERGSNANGSFLRLADGTQICRVRLAGIPVTQPIGPFLRSEPFAWTFPAPFVAGPASESGPHVTGSVLGANGLWVHSPDGASTTVAEGLRAHAWSAEAAAACHLTAIGRWY